MNAFSFGRFVAEKVAAGPAGGLITSGTEPLQGPKPMGHKAPDRTGPGFLQSYGNVLDRWYNPRTKQQVTERGEHGLMRAGQAAMGIGAAAGAAAGGLALAAPGVAAMPLSQVPGAVAGGVGAAATQGQNAINKLHEFGGNAWANVQSRMPHRVQHGWHQYSEAMEPVEKAFPHIDKWTAPVEQMAHHGTHVLEHAGGGHGPIAHAGVAGQ